MEQRRTAKIRQPCVFVLWNTLLTKRLCHRERQRATTNYQRQLKFAASSLLPLPL